MAFSKALLIKGLAGAAAVGTVGGGVVLGKKIGNLPKTKEKDKNEEKVVPSVTEGDVGEDKKDSKEVNGRLETLGLEGDCILDDGVDPTDFSRECPLNLERLKKIKFSNKGEGEVKVVGQVPQELKLNIKGTKEDISFSFKGISSSPLAIFGDKSKGKIVIKSEEQKFKEKDGMLTKENRNQDIEKLNEQLGKVNAPIECRFDEAETDASVECPVTADDLKGIKFSGLGEGELKDEGQVPDGLKLKAERDDQNALSLYFTGLSGDLTIYVDKSKGKIVIKDGKKFRVGEDGKMEKVFTAVELALKAKIGEFNKQLRKIKAPTECKFDEEEAEESVECSISLSQLKKMEFSNKKAREDLEIVGSVDQDLKLKVERDSEDAISLSFPQQTTELKIFGKEDEGKIILNKDKKFKVEKGKLTKGNPNAKIKELNKQLGTVEAPDVCRFDEAESEESLECPITQDQFELLKFSNKGDETLTVKTWPDGGNVKLKVEKKDQSAMSISFPGLGATTSSPVTIYGEGGKIVVKSEEQKFKVVDSKLTKESSNVNETLKNFNEQLGKVKVPIECRFDETETEESVECSVSGKQLKTMLFSEDDEEIQDLSDENFSGMKLNVQIVKKLVKEVSDMLLTFRGYDKTVKVLNEGNREIVSLVKNTNPEFEIKGDDEDEVSDSFSLEKKWYSKTLGDSLGLKCDFEDGKAEGECSFTEGSAEINVGKGAGDDFEKLTINDKSGKSFELHENQEDFNQGFKFVFKGTRVPEQGDSGVSLEPGSSYEFKWKAQAGKARDYYLAKRTN